MKLIHCADIHLDSKMQTHMPEQKAFARNAEITKTFLRITEYAQSHGVQVVMIAGDLFDTRRVSRKTVDMVLHSISNTPSVDYLYLSGNHDERSVALTDREIPSNLKLFSEQWKTFSYGNVSIHGIEMNPQNENSLYNGIPIEPGRYNIVMLHGQVGYRSGLDMVNLNLLRGRGIQYLALGHLHTYQGKAFDEGGVYCYPGCLEGRGFDECGPKGFVLLEIDERSVRNTFIPFAKRQLHRVRVDVTDCLDNSSAYQKIKRSCLGISSEDMVEFILTGKYNVDSSLSPSWLQNLIQNDFYFSKVKDESVMAIEPADYKNDISLKGEFIRLVLASDFTEKEKSVIIRTGIQSLSEEEITL